MFTLGQQVTVTDGGWTGGIVKIDRETQTAWISFPDCPEFRPYAFEALRVTGNLMTSDQARIFQEAKSAYVLRIAKMPKAKLTVEYRTELADRGMSLLAGGPVTRDELVNAIISLRYPTAKLNESIHVLYHVDGITNDICAYCNPDPCPTCGALDVCDYASGFGAVVNGRHVNA